MTLNRPYEDDEQFLTDGRMKSQVISLAQFFAQAQQQKYIVKGCLSIRDISLLFGPTGVGTTTFACEFAAAVLSGQSVYMGLELGLYPGKVLLVTPGTSDAEIERKARILQEYPLDVQDQMVLNRFSPFDSAEDIWGQTLQVTGQGEYNLVIVDTLLDILPGVNLNSAPDVGRILTKWRDLANMSEVAILFIGNENKAQKSAKPSNKAIYGSTQIPKSMAAVLYLQVFEGRHFLSMTKGRGGILDEYAIEMRRDIGGKFQYVSQLDLFEYHELVERAQISPSLNFDWSSVLKYGEEVTTMELLALLQDKTGRTPKTLERWLTDAFKARLLDRPFPGKYTLGPNFCQ